MIKIIYRILISLIILFLITVAYLSTIGVKTDKFNSKIISQIKQIEPNIELRLNDVSATLDIFNFGINAKTIGTNLIYRDKIIKIETIKSKISIKSFLNDEFALTGISVSTKSLAIKDLISFIRLFNNDPKLFIAEQFINSGYLVADLELEFDESGNIKNNYKLNGLVRDGRINIIKRYDLNKIDFIFEINKKNLRFKDVKLFLNNKNISLPELVALKQNKKYLISGKLNNKKTILTKNEIKDLINNDLSELDFKEITFSSKNNFNFTINKKLKIKKLDIKSNIDLDNLKIQNSLELKNIFPQIKKSIILKNQKIKLKYEKDNLNIDGEGSVLIQNEIDKIKYKISSIKDEVKYNIDYVILKNPFELDLINYKKDIDSDLQLNFQVKQNVKEKLRFFNISLKEKNNFITIKNLALSNNNKINDVRNININYTDKDNLINNIKIIKKDKDYVILGHSFNIDSIIEKLLSSENELKLDILDKDIKLIIDIDKIYLDKNNITNNLNGFFLIINNEISELNLESNFSNQKNIKLTIKNNGEEKITTLFSHEAKPLVSRYKFIKGFEEGELDFYSIKKNGTTKSILKIDNFKIQEIPVLAKLLTLASLQGIADLLTGEGIRFTDFEMKFLNKDKLMTIEELYAIGPAISILMDGYIESNKLISLRGTLVPATTVNRTISSIPIIGDILVGKKVGEGVFGVSFKIKGPPKNLQTTVNPIKTLTPRFITRTLEKIKKN
jgi:hypothetical protein